MALKTYSFTSWLILGFFLSATISLTGCQGDLPVVEESSSAENDLKVIGDPPKVVVEEEVYDFGSMQVGETLTHEFVIRNEGKGVLLLEKDRSTCKCTMAAFDKAEVAPGESTKITLEWIGKVLDPAFSQAAYIKTNDPDKREISIGVAGRVDQSFDIMPAGAWNLGEMNRDQATEFTGTISSRVLEKFDVTSIECDNPLVQVEVTPMSPEKLEELGAKHGYNIQGKVAPGAPIGSFSETVKLVTDVNGKQENGILNIEGYYSGPLQIVGPAGWKASEMLLVMGRFPAEEGKSVTLSVFLRDNEAGDVETTQVTTVPNDIQVEWSKDEKFQAENRERYNLKIIVPPGAPPLQYDRDAPATVLIETNNPLMDKMNLKLHILSY